MIITEKILALILSQVHSIPLLQNKYNGSLAIIISFSLLGWVLLALFNFYLKTIAKKTETVFDDLLFEYLNKPIFYFIFFLGIKVALINLGINDVITTILNCVLAITFLFILMRLLDAIIEGWGKTFAQKTESKLDDVLLPLFHKIAKVLFCLFALVWILHLFNVNIGPYLAGLGVGGIILGLALQDSLKNVLGGINLLVDNTYQVGDKIKLESGEVGIIHDIGLRSTKLTTFDNEVIYIPNGYLANSRVLNFTQPNEKVRSKVEFSVEYGSDVEKAKKIVLSAISKMKNLAKDPAPSVQFYEMGDFALKFRLFFWVDHWEKEAAKKIEATGLIYEALRKHRINIPFPTQMVYMKK